MAPYNLLFLFTDEQRADTMAAYGNTQIQTPNLNRLSDQSIVFDQAYVTQPVCTPSRSSIMTGLYPHTNGCTENNLPLAPEIPTLVEMLEQDGYATAYHGKWHLGDEIYPQHGFQEWRGIEDGYAKYYRPDKDPQEKSDYYHFLIKNGFEPQNGDRFGRGEAARLPEQFSKPAFLAQEASRFIQENQDNPFVLYVNFLEPHMPFFGPRDDQHDPATIPMPINYLHPPTADQPLKTRLFHRGYQARGYDSEEAWRQLIARYWGLCSQVDTYAGRILETLDECGLAENTLVVYTSDHGDMMSSHQLLAKCVMFEEAVRVPLLMRLPGQTVSRHVRGPVSQIDLVPTLLDLMGQPIPETLEGKSLKPLLDQDGDVAPEEDVFIEWNGPNNGFGDVSGQVSIPDWMTEIATPEKIQQATRDRVRTIIIPEGWKFNYSPWGEHELYNLKQDPGEINNLANQEQYATLMQALTQRIIRWQERTKDTAKVSPLSAR
jgi:arylsulfatase A-like enzyme